MQVSNTPKSALSLYAIINKQYYFLISCDRFPVPVRSAVKSNFTNCCCQNLSNGALNALTVQTSTTELGKLLQILAMRAANYNNNNNDRLTAFDPGQPG